MSYENVSSQARFCGNSATPTADVAEKPASLGIVRLPEMQDQLKFACCQIQALVAERRVCGLLQVNSTEMTQKYVSPTETRIAAVAFETPRQIVQPQNMPLHVRVQGTSQVADVAEEGQKITDEAVPPNPMCHLGMLDEVFLCRAFVKADVAGNFEPPASREDYLLTLGPYSEHVVTCFSG